MIAIPNMEKPKHCGMCEFQDMCACILLREPIPYDINVLPDCPLIEIIPCKECKNSHMTYDGKCKYCDLEKDDDDNFIECYFDGDHFCKYGERANNTRTE